MVWIAGMDEAGRGPVVGSLVVCAYAIEEEKELLLRKLRVRDSKQLTKEQREALAPRLLQAGRAALVENTATELNQLMKRYSLNDIEAMKMAAALHALEENVRLDRVFVDSPDPVLDTFNKRLRKYYKGPAELLCDHKADQKYPVVSAASVVAKVARDEGIKKIVEEVGEDFGSGYSHDERTIAFLKKHWKDKAHPIHKYVRSEWETAKKLKVIQFKLDQFL